MKSHREIVGVLCECVWEHSMGLEIGKNKDPPKTLSRFHDGIQIANDEGDFTFFPKTQSMKNTIKQMKQTKVGTYFVSQIWEWDALTQCACISVSFVKRSRNHKMIASL